MNPWGLLVAGAGLFSIMGAVMDWEWFMNSSRARIFVTIFTRTGARIFYILLGLGLAVLGVLMAMGIIQDHR
jgi:hypothetical protein